MNAAETSASSAIALWTELTVVSRSFTTDAIETFISDVSTTSTNIAAASTSGNRPTGARPPGTPPAASLIGAASCIVVVPGPGLPDQPRPTVWHASLASHHPYRMSRHPERPVTIARWPDRTADERESVGAVGHLAAQVPGPAGACAVHLQLRRLEH